MKKLLLFAASLLLATGLMAQTPTVEDFNLKIGTTEVTTGNAANIFEGVEGLDGKVSFDAGTYTLTLDNVNMENYPIVVNPSDPWAAKFYIHIIGKCNLRTFTSAAGTINAQVDELIIYSLDGDNGELLVAAHNNENEYSVHAIKVKRGSEYKDLVLKTKTYAYSNNDVAIDATNVTIEGVIVDAFSEKAGSRGFAQPSHVTLNGVEVMYPSHSKDLGFQEVLVAPASMKEFYGVIVNGIEVTNFNQFDPLEDGSRTMTWMPDVKMLYLANASSPLNISPAAGVCAIEFQVPATLLILEEAQSIQLDGAANAPVIKTNSDLKIMGRSTLGSVNISNPAHKVAIALEPGDEDITLTFEETEIETILSDQFSIAKIGSGAGEANIVVKKSKLTLNNNVSGIASLERHGCDYEGGVDYDINDGEIYDYGTNVPVSGTIKIVPEEYPILIAGMPVDAFSAADILNDGKVSYNPEKHVLKLADGAEIMAVDVPAISVIGDIDLTIVAEGEASIHSDEAQAVKFEASSGRTLTFVAESQWKSLDILTKNQGSQHGIISAFNNNIEFKGEGRFQVGALEDTPNATPHLVWASQMAVNAILSVYTEDHDYNGSMFNVSHIALNEALELGDSDMEIEDNAGVVWKDGTGKTLVSDPIQIVDFGLKYLGRGINIAGKEVTMLNKDDILGDGKISYDADTHTLTLNRAMINVEDHPSMEGIFFDGGEITLELIGRSDIYCNAANAITAMSKLTIKAKDNNGILFCTTTGDWAHNACFYAEDGLMITDGAAVEAHLYSPMDEYGVALISSGASGELEIVNGDLRAYVDNPDAIAIQCMQYIPDASVTFRKDTGMFDQDISWDGSAFVNANGGALNAIWMGVSDEFPSDDPMQVENINASVEKAVKVLRDGQIMILRGGKIYSITGSQIQ